MNQGSNFKKEVMEALFNAPTNLINNKAVMWALSNLPDEGGNGTFTTRTREYHHDSKSFWEAIGMTGDMSKTQDELRDLMIEYVKTHSDGDFGKSHVFEEVEKAKNPELLYMLAVHGFMSFYEAFEKAQEQALGSIGDLLKDHDLDGLLKHLKEIKKRLGGEE